MEDISSESVPSRKSSGSELLFLAFPYNVRLKVYEFTGLVRDSPICLNKQALGSIIKGEWLPKKNALSKHDHCTCYDPLACYYSTPISNQLFFVSSVISKDARQVLYSMNAFEVYAYRPEALSVLGRLGAVAVNSLRHLRVQLKLDGAGVGNMNDWRRDDISWDTICSRMAEYVEPHALDLRLSVPTESREEVEQFLAPIMSLPSLLHCFICLGHRVNRKFQRLAHATVRNACRKDDTRTGVFRFFHWDFARELDSNLLSEPGQKNELVAALHLVTKSILPSHHNLARLTIAVDLTYIPYWEQHANAQFLNNMLRSYQCFVDLMLPMKDIRDFFVYNIGGFRRDYAREMSKNPEILLERKLKGANYDSTKRKIPRKMMCWNCH